MSKTVENILTLIDRGFIYIDELDAYRKGKLLILLRYDILVCKIISPYYAKISYKLLYALKDIHKAVHTTY